MFGKDKISRLQAQCQNKRFERKYCCSTKLVNTNNSDSTTWLKGLSTLNFENERVRSMEEHTKRKAEREEEC